MLKMMDRKWKNRAGKGFKLMKWKGLRAALGLKTKAGQAMIARVCKLHKREKASP